MRGLFEPCVRGNCAAFKRTGACSKVKGPRLSRGSGSSWVHRSEMVAIAGRTLPCGLCSHAAHGAFGKTMMVGFLELCPDVLVQPEHWALISAACGPPGHSAVRVNLMAVRSNRAVGGYSAAGRHGSAGSNGS